MLVHWARTLPKNLLPCSSVRAPLPSFHSALIHLCGASLTSYVPRKPDKAQNFSRHERLSALNAARNEGLDVEAVAFVTASLTVREELKVRLHRFLLSIAWCSDVAVSFHIQKLPGYTKELPSLANIEMHVLPSEYVLCRSVEWLTFHPSNYEAALRQANALMRYLLGQLNTHDLFLLIAYLSYSICTIYRLRSYSGRPGAIIQHPTRSDGRGSQLPG